MSNQLVSKASNAKTTIKTKSLFQLVYLTSFDLWTHMNSPLLIHHSQFTSWENYDKNCDFSGKSNIFTQQHDTTMVSSMSQVEHEQLHAG